MTLGVTDQAVLTYLELVHGVDILGLRRRIAREAVAAVICPIPGATAVRRNGVRFALAGTTVVRVTRGDMMPYDPALARRPRWRTELA